MKINIFIIILSLWDPLKPSWTTFPYPKPSWIGVFCWWIAFGYTGVKLCLLCVCICTHTHTKQRPIPMSECGTIVDVSTDRASLVWYGWIFRNEPNRNWQLIENGCNFRKCLTCGDSFRVRPKCPQWFCLKSRVLVGLAVFVLMGVRIWNEVSEASVRNLFELLQLR